MLIDRNRSSPNESKPTLELRRQLERIGKPSLCSCCILVATIPLLKKRFIERDKRRIGIDLFHRFHTAFQTLCPLPPTRIAADLASAPSLIAPLRCPLSIALFISATRKKLAYENYSVARGEKEKEKEERRRRKKREEKERGKKRGSRRSVHASGNASCMPIVGRISRGT